MRAGTREIAAVDVGRRWAHTQTVVTRDRPARPRWRPTVVRVLLVAAIVVAGLLWTAEAVAAKLHSIPSVQVATTQPTVSGPIGVSVRFGVVAATSRETVAPP